MVDETTFVLAEEAGYTDHPIRFESWCSIEEKGYCVTAIHMGAHAGTHCDVSSHYVVRSRSITDHDLSEFVGWAVVLNLKGVGPITRELLRPHAEKITRDKDSVVVL